MRKRHLATRAHHEHLLALGPMAPNILASAASREPSRLRPGPEGTWPLRYDRLVQPVLDKHCVRCHSPKGKAEALQHQAARAALDAGLSVAAAALRALSARDLFAHQPLAGEHLFAAGVGLGYALVFTRVWPGFRTLPDWRVALEVPTRAKLFAAAGSALSASLAGAALALLLFTICAKRTSPGLLERLGADDLGKVQLLVSLLCVFFYFVLLWRLFDGVMELRESARTAMGLLLSWVAVLALAAELGRLTGLLPVTWNAGVTALLYVVGVPAVIGAPACIALTGTDARRHFRANEF